MPNDALDSSPRSDPVDLDAAAKEDADTAAARKELKQTAISDSHERPDGSTTPDGATETEAEAEALREQVSSPKKKRAHDQVDDDDQAAEANDANSDISSDSAKDRTIRSEPEKKRPRDEMPALSLATGSPRVGFPPPVRHVNDYV